MTGRIHAATKLTPRLRRVLAVLREYEGSLGASTRLILLKAHVCAVNTCVAELRAQGYEIACTLAHVGADGERVYVYRLVAEPSVPSTEPVPQAAVEAS